MSVNDPLLAHEAIRAAMAIPSADRMRGLKDGVGFATTPEQMAVVFAASAQPPEPRILGPAPDRPVIGVICPHDDLLYAGRVYRRALEHVRAKTVVVIGTFHAGKKFEHGFGVFDGYEAWWTPDGPAPVSSLREAVRERLGPWSKTYKIDNDAMDHEHSIESIVAWLKHQDPEVEILPILPPSNRPPVSTLACSASILGQALGNEMKDRGLVPGRDVAVVISVDAIHYGPDFDQTRYGSGPEAYERAVEEDVRILTSLFSGPAATQGPWFELYETFIDRKNDDAYRWTWCGRYAILFGLLFMEAMGGSSVNGWPLAYETSLAPPLDVHRPPLGFTAPASYEHFVGYPAVAFTFASTGET